MNGFLTSDFNRTGRAGKVIDIGKSRELGASRAINLAHNNSDRNQDNKGNSNTNRGPRSRNKESLRSSNLSSNRRKEFSNRKDKNKDLSLRT